MEPNQPFFQDDDFKKDLSSFILLGEYTILFIGAVIILSVVCIKSTSRLRTRLVYFYIITIIIALCIQIFIR